MIKAEDSLRHSELNEHHYTCECGKKVYFDDSDLKGETTSITCPNCGVKTEYTYLKLGEKKWEKS